MVKIDYLYIDHWPYKIFEIFNFTYVGVGFFKKKCDFLFVYTINSESILFALLKLLDVAMLIIKNLSAKRS